MAVARVNDIDIWYEITGAGPTLVLTHGFAGPYWADVVHAEFGAKFRLLTYDVRGHGRTAVPAAETFSMPQFSADLAGLLDATDIRRTHIAGVSMGGMISAQFACDYPERVQSLALCDTTAGNGGDPATAQLERDLVTVFEREASIVEQHGLPELISRQNRYRHTRDKYAALSTETLEQQDAKNAKKLTCMTAEGFLRSSMAIRARPDLTSRTPSIAAPTLVSCGEWDMFYPLAVRDHRLIDGSRLATIRGAAHSTPDYQPQRWKRAIFDFIDDVEARQDVRGEVEYGD